MDLTLENKEACMRRVVYLQTKNQQKLEEYRKILGRYNIGVLQLSEEPDFSKDGFPFEFRQLLSSQETEQKVIAILKEESGLYIPGTDQVASHDHLTVVENRTTLTAFIKNKATITYMSRQYSAVVSGYIDRKRAVADKSYVFGWDDIFVSAGCQLTYHEMRQKGLKLSARDKVLAEYIKGYLYYKERKDLKHNPQGQTTTIDFANSVIDFVRGNKYLNNPHIAKYGLKNLIDRVLASGLFLRSPKNQREWIYWMPGANAGIPLTAKSDDVHEVTYGAHDLIHFAKPDLVPDGEASLLHRKVSIVYRMMSEAFTIVYADMLFIDTLEKSGVEYDFSKRKIKPLYDSLTLDMEGDMAGSIKKLLYASVRYCLLGDDSYYKALGADPVALQAFKDKYKPFFVEDYRWTDQNTSFIFEEADRFKKWRTSVKPLTEKFSHYLKGSMTVSDCIKSLHWSFGELDSMKPAELVDAIFEMSFNMNIAPALVGNTLPEVDREAALRGAFLKYVIGQLHIFDVYDFVPEAKIYREQIVKYLDERLDTLDLAGIETVRAFYNQFVDILSDRSIISTDDRDTYKEIFPLFPPFYIHYDGAKETYEELDVVSQRILNR